MAGFAAVDLTSSNGIEWAKHHAVSVAVFGESDFFKAIKPYFDPTSFAANGVPLPASIQGGKRPIGVVLWGLVSDEVDARLTAGTTRLRPHDWKSGDKAWVVEVIAPFGGGDAMVADLKAQVLKDRELRALVVTDGRREVRVM